MLYLQIFREITLEFSKSGTPTICTLLTMYKLSEVSLQQKIYKLEEKSDPYNFLPAFKSALEKQKKYLAFALRSKYSILGLSKLSLSQNCTNHPYICMIVLHPAVRMTQFADRSKWSEKIEKRARALMRDEFDAYAERHGINGIQQADAAYANSSTSDMSLFARTVKQAPSAVPIRSELDRFYDMSQYPWPANKNPLEWFKVFLLTFLEFVISHLLSVIWHAFPRHFADGARHFRHSSRVRFC